MAHLNIDTTHRPSASRTHLCIDAARNHIACGPLPPRVVMCHEAIPRAIEQITASTAQTLFKHRARHAGIRSTQQTRRMELNHFHIPEFEAITQSHCQTITGLVTGWRVKFVHGGPTPGGKQYSLRLDQTIGSSSHVDEQHPRYSGAIGSGNQLNGTMLFHLLNIQGTNLLHQTIDDLNARQICFMNSTVKTLTSKSFLMQRTIWVSVKETPHLIF